MHDAIGNHVLQVRRLLRQAGYESDIWADRIDERLAGEAKPYLRWKPQRDSALLYHLSTDSAMAAWLAHQAERGTPILCDYHNITPAAFFRRWEPDIARRLDEARAQLRSLASVTLFAVADSGYNRAELLDAGYPSVEVSPIIADLSAFQSELQSRATRADVHGGSRGGARWLFVGRVAPNKCQHDVVGAFAVYRKLFDPAATLTLVGSPSSFRYLRALRRLEAELEVDGAVEHLTDIPLKVLVERYLSADVFVCLSEHEGFCVPLLEAMSAGIPVVAYSAGAVPETLGSGGILLDQKDPLDVASTVYGLLQDPELAVSLASAGRNRSAELSPERTGPGFLQTLAAWFQRGLVPPKVSSS